MGLPTFVSMDITNNPLLQKSIEFSLSIIRYVEHLEEAKKFVVAKQLLRAATSIGANAMEAQSAESRADFIHKLKISDKEAHETLYWLMLCNESETYPSHTKLLPQLEEIMKLLNTIIKTSKNTNR